MRVRCGDLRLQIDEPRPGVYRVDVRPVGADKLTPAAGDAQLRSAVRVDAAAGALVIRRDGQPVWNGRVRRLPTFGRAQAPGLEIAWAAAPDEGLYGLGERFNAFNQYGRRAEMWIEDAPGQGDDSARTYYVAPVLFSTAGYAFFAADNPEGVFDLNSQGAGQHVYQRAGSAAVFFIAVGADLRELVARRAAVQGPFRTIPDWAWGPWISRNSFESQAAAEDALAGMFKRGLPVAAMVQEAWKGSSEQRRSNDFSASRWPDLKRFFDYCNRHGVKNILWQVPIVHPAHPGFAEAAAKGYFVRKPDGSVSFRQHWLAGFANVDFTNPEAVKYWQDQMRATVRLGIGGFKTDDGEDIKPDDVFADGRRGWQMHNEYSVLYGQAVMDLLNQERIDGLLWSRSGSLGIERIPALWAGDQYANWQQLASLLPAGLSASISGAPFWGHDIGAYIGRPSAELYIRWAQFGALSPLMQYHGIERREPWEFGPEAEAAYRLLAFLRMNLKPTLIALGREAAESGQPIMRPMIMHYPGEPAYRAEQTQYLLGPDLLVAPVLEAGARGRAVFFPEGVWHHALRPFAYRGPGRFEVPVELCDAPLFLREGAKLPLQYDEKAGLGEWRADMPERELAVADGRSVIINPRVCLVGDTMLRTNTVTFDLHPSFAGRLAGYWFFEDQPARKTPVEPRFADGRWMVDGRPPSGTALDGRRQTLVLEDVVRPTQPRRLWQATVRWESPISLQLDDAPLPVAQPGARSVRTRVRNQSTRPIATRVCASATADARIKPAEHRLELAPGATGTLEWNVEFLPGPAVGDSRLRFQVMAGDAEMASLVCPYVRSPRWAAVGPFLTETRRAHGPPFAPEWTLDADTGFAADGRVVKWTAVPEHALRMGGVDFIALYGLTENAAAYALTYLRSEIAQPVELRFGSDDTLTVWLNGERLFSAETYRWSEPDQNIIPARLRAGVNTLLVKVGQDRDPWNFILRITGPNGARVAGLRDGFADIGRFQANRAVARTRPARQQPFDWQVAGPWTDIPDPARAGALPQDAMALASAWPPPAGREWRRVPPDRCAENLLDLNEILGYTPSGLAYAAATVRVDRPVNAEIIAGSDDGLMLWLNGRLVVNANQPRRFQAGSERVRVALQPGANRLLCRVSQGGGEWKLQVNLSDLSRPTPEPIEGR